MTSTQYKTGNGIYDGNERSQWLRLIAREDLMNRNSSYFYVCEKHFNKEDILGSSKRKILSKDVMPSLHLPSPQKWNKETQIELIETSKFTQTERRYILSDNVTQTPLYKRRLKPDLPCSRKKPKRPKVEMGSEEWEKDQFRELCSQLMSEELCEIVKAQTYLKKYHDKGRRALAYETFCMNLYYTSPAAYRLLKDVLHLPCKTALYKSYVPVSTEVRDDSMTVLKVKAENMSNDEKNCSVLLDVLNLKANLFYNFKTDKVIGFHEVDGVQSPVPAKCALVVIVQGIFVKWTQPVGYALLSEYKYSDEVSKWIDKILTKLLDIGLNIRALVLNLKLDFLDVAKKKYVSPERPYFFVGGRKIYIIFDPSHLLQLVCNNLMKYDFHYLDDGVAKLEHIVLFYNVDKTRNLRLAPKLSNEHISPSNFEEMNVCYATQLLSKSVAAGVSSYVNFDIIDKPGKDTAQFVWMMNDLFDVLNSSALHHNYEYKKAFCGDSDQITFLNRMFVFFKSLKVINPESESGFTQDVGFVKGFQITIRSILHLFDDLKREGHEYLLTRRLSQDISRELVRKIRLKNNSSTEPTGRQFVSAFRKLYFCSILDRPKKGNPKDMTKVILHLTDLKVLCDSDQVDEDSVRYDDNSKSNELRDIVRSDYDQFIFPSTHCFLYICGALLKRCSEKHKDCPVFASYVDSNRKIPNLGAEIRYLRYKNNMYGLLVTPPDDFIDYVRRMDDVFRDALVQRHLNSGIGTSIYQKIKKVTFTPPCPCFPRVYLKKLFVRMRIYVTMLSNNRAFNCSLKANY